MAHPKKDYSAGMTILQVIEDVVAMGADTAEWQQLYAHESPNDLRAYYNRVVQECIDFKPED